MVKIVIESLGKKEVFVNDLSQTVLSHLHANYIDWMHSCGGKGRCTSCKMIVLEGMEHLSSLTAPERKYSQEGQLRANERLTCQSLVKGDILIGVPPESRLPHIHYTDLKPS